MAIKGFVCVGHLYHNDPIVNFYPYKEKKHC